MPGGANSIQRWKKANPAAWEARLTVKCRTCGAAVDRKCVALDGSGREIEIVHICRLEDVSQIITN